MCRCAGPWCTAGRLWAELVRRGYILEAIVLRLMAAGNQAFDWSGLQLSTRMADMCSMRSMFHAALGISQHTADAFSLGSHVGLPRDLLLAVISNVDQHEQYLLSLLPEQRPLVVQRFHATDDLEGEFGALVSFVGHFKPWAWEALGASDSVDELTDLRRGSGPAAGDLAVLPSQKRKYDGNAATLAVAAEAWQSAGKLRPSGTQRRATYAGDLKKARRVVSNNSTVRSFHKS